LARLHASNPRRNPRQSRDLSGRTPAAISARSRLRRASGAVRPQSTLREGAFCCAKHPACLWRPVRCRRIVRASSSRLPTAATATGACSERLKQDAGSQAPRAASAEAGGRRIRFSSSIRRSSREAIVCNSLSEGLSTRKALALCEALPRDRISSSTARLCGGSPQITDQGIAACPLSA
jgi:hypothetical protein